MIKSIARRAGLYGVILFGVVFGSGCGTQLSKVSKQENEPIWFSWGLSGKISVQVNSKTQNANLLWEARGDDYKILLYGPLGQGKITIENRNQQLSLKKDGDVTYAASPEELLYSKTGLTLPVSSLSYWVRGLVAPTNKALTTQTSLSTMKAATVEKNTKGQILSLRQAGWDVEYKSYYPNNNSSTDATSTQIKSLPKKMILRRAAFLDAYGNTQPSIKVLIVVKEWQS